MIDDKALIAKADAGEGLTVEEIKCYQQLIKPQHHVYGIRHSRSTLYGRA